MTQIIDRRSNHNKDKNVANRQRFIQRVKGQIKDNVNLNIQKGKLSDLAKGDKIKIKVKDTKEPKFGQDSETGVNDTVVPGNEHFNRGDQLEKPQKNGGRGRDGGLGEDESDDIVFTLTKDEFLDILFEDLELPDMVKKDIRGSTITQPERRGYTTTGSPNNLDILRSSKNALGRRIALKRVGKKKVKELQAELEKLNASVDDAQMYWNELLDKESFDAISAMGQVQELLDKKYTLENVISRALKKQKAIPYLDFIDVRYRKFDKVPKPITNAVMFCLMDVSGSMGEKEKDIAKRFFLLLYLFLDRKYEKVDVVFVRHTTHAEEVDEDTFFHDPLSGGTQISSGLALINEIIEQRYDVEKTNIYISQASDGGNYDHDNSDCEDIIVNKLIDKLQYFAYIEIVDHDLLARRMLSSGMNDDDNAELWDYYQSIERKYPHFKSKRIADKSEIFQVFKDLFAKKV